MDIRKIKTLIELIKTTGVGEIELKSGEESVRISLLPSSTANVSTYSVPVVSQATPIPVETKTQHAPEAHPSSAANLKEGHTVKAPMVGTVYLASTPGAKPFVEIGQSVYPGDTLCLIEAMKMFNKIEADKAGVLSARLVENEQPVEYDQSLFIIE